MTTSRRDPLKNGTLDDTETKKKVMKQKTHNYIKKQGNDVVQEKQFSLDKLKETKSHMRGLQQLQIFAQQLQDNKKEKSMNGHEQKVTQELNEGGTSK